MSDNTLVPPVEGLTGKTVEIKTRKTDINQLEGLKKKARNNPWIQRVNKYLISRQAGRWFVGMVMIPWLLAAIYYLGFASDRYVSDASFMIEKSDGSGAGVEGLSLLGVTPQAANDQKILETFIKSPDMLYYLDQQTGLKQHYMESADWLSALGNNASHEDFLTYYRDHISVRFNDSNGMLEMEIQGFTPEYAQKLSKLILQHSEAFVNEISHGIANEQLEFVRQEVAISEERLKDMSAKLVTFQNETGMLSVSEQGAALNGIMNELQAELIRSRTELETLTAFLNSNSAQVVGLKQRIAALEKQLGKEQTRLIDGESTTLNDLAARQQELQLELDLSTKAYSSALIALEGARTEASRKLKQLVVISSPYLSEEAKYPRALYSLINIFLILLMIYALARMIRATIREHKD